MALLAGLLLALVGWVDYATGPLLAFSPFYVAVLVIVALRAGRSVALGFAALAAAGYLAVDLLTTPGLATTVYPYWRAAAQLMNFSVVAFTIPALIADRRRLARSERALLDQRRELEALNTRLLRAMEDSETDRDRMLRQLIEEHSAEVRELRTLLIETRKALAPTA